MTRSSFLPQVRRVIVPTLLLKRFSALGAIRILSLASFVKLYSLRVNNTPGYLHSVFFSVTMQLDL